MPPSLKDLQNIPNAAQPTPGQGLTLDHNGLIPGTVLAPTPTDQYLLRWNVTTVRPEWALATGSSLAPVYADYTPVLTATTTNPTLGAGSVQIGRYIQIGKFVSGIAVIVFGGAGLAAGSGTYRISTPVTAASTGKNTGSGTILDNSANLVRNVTDELATTGTFQMRIDNTGLGLVTDAVPWTWATNDTISLFFTYEAA